MKAELTYTENFAFESKIRDHNFTMDTQSAAGGDNRGPSPKELLLASILGCTGMDIIAVLKKYKIKPSKLLLRGDAEPRSEHPRVFKSVQIDFEVEGSDIPDEALKHAVHESLTKFCGVSAMVSKVVPIHYKVILNGVEIGHGSANFDI